MLTVQSANFGYGRKAVVRDVSFDLKAGQVLAILGTNGAGKSTLVRTLLGLQPLLGGNLSWHAGKPDPCAYLSQLTDFDRTFPMSVQEMVRTGHPRATPAQVTAALERVHLMDEAKMPIHELSGGQLQRARFARTIVQDARLIILDEPFSAVDQRREADLLGLISDWAKEGRALILVLHSLSAALKVCSHALLLGGGGGDFGPTHEILNAQSLIARGYMSQDQADIMHEAAHG